MGMPAVDMRRWMYEEAYALIDAQEDRSIRYEYADGELLVTPAPSGYHQRIILDLYRLIDPYVRWGALGEVRLGPSPVALVPRTIFQPDLYVVPSVDGRRPRADVPRRAGDCNSIGSSSTSRTACRAACFGFPAGQAETRPHQPRISSRVGLKSQIVTSRSL